MALFNKEPETNPISKPASNSQVQPAHIPPPPPADSNAAAKPPSTATSGARAHLDSKSKITGKLHFDGPVQIDGHVEGEIVAAESLTVGETAVINAQIKASLVIVAGSVKGDITASRVEIEPSAKVLGSVTAPVLIIREGARFEGHCEMEPKVHEDRKLSVLPKPDDERPAQAAGLRR